jgi:hypothetical protein
MYKDKEVLRQELGQYRALVDLEAFDKNIYMDKNELSMRAIRSYRELESFLDNAFMCTIC